MHNNLNIIKGSIGIAFTEYNRYNVFKKSYNEMLKFLPEGAKLVVVDDASIKPFSEATFRFNTNVGIAKAKNKCIELLERCEHIFLFDSDTYPLCKDWHLPYINSKHKHLMYIFKDFHTGDKLNDSSLEYEDNDIKAYTHPRGCMLYLHNDCIKKVGGMRSEFGKWGVDHVELSERIYHAGLTKYKFMDVAGSDKLIHSMDEHRQVITTVNGLKRAKELKESLEVYDKVKGSSNFVPYKQKNLILTCYLTTLIDPQRDIKWPYNPNAIDALKKSIPEGVYFHCIDDTKGYKPKHSNPYMAKWIAFKEFLEANKCYDNVFLVDGTDVEVLNNPFHYIDHDKLYVGDEPGTLKNSWLIHRHPTYREWLTTNHNLPILNAGILGGSITPVLAFLDKMIIKCINEADLTDMAAFNHTLRVFFNDKLVFGRQVNTVFKAEDRINKHNSWFKHK